MTLVAEDSEALEALGDEALLARHRQDAGAGAFEVLVRRNMGVVYWAALRQVGSAAEAEDVTQAVFVLLWRKAGGVRGPVAGWLLTTTRFVVLNAQKMERRRKWHEGRAAKMNYRMVGEGSAAATWESYAPYLDEAMATLRGEDRDALVLRYLRGMTWAEVAGALKVSEGAARKRADRALARVRELLVRRIKVVPAAAVLAADVAARGAPAAPAGLAQSVVQLSASGGGASGAVQSLVNTVEKAMTYAKLKLVALVLVCATTTVAVTAQTLSRPGQGGAGMATAPASGPGKSWTQQRLDVAVEGLRFADQRWAAGLVGEATERIEWSARVMQAKRDVPGASAADKAAAIAEHRDRVRQAETLTKQQYEKGLATVMQWQDMRYKRIEVEEMAEGQGVP